MGDIELLIKINEEQYKFIKQSMTFDAVKNYPALLYDICEHIANGTPLPKGHGRLIDADTLIYLTETCIETTDAFIELIQDAQPIIEADKEC